MDNPTPETQKYIDNLPKSIQDLIFDGVWETRTLEIGKKYSLNDVQVDNLANIVLYLLTGLEQPDTFLETLITELGISRLLAEQIVEDLEARVFEYAINFIENKEKTRQTSPVPKKIEPQNKFAESPEFIETKLNSLPPLRTPPTTNQTVAKITEPKSSESEKVSVPRYVPEYKPVQKTENPQVEASGPSRINYSPKPVAPELVQKPLPVPRFTTTPTPEVSLEASVKALGNGVEIPKNIIENKLNTVTTGVQEKSVTPPEIKKYSTDPYREPLN